MHPQVVIFGSSGLIGRSLAEKLGDPSKKRVLFLPKRDELLLLERAELWKKLSTSAPTTVFYCHGPTDPATDPSELLRHHVELPKVWFEKFANETNLTRFVTLGSVQEAGIEISTNNAYLAAKRNWLATRESLGPRSVHFQLHTVYGKPIRARSFLGQMKDAIANRTEFRMSEGLQMREYQSVSDVTDLLVRALDADWKSKQGNTFAVSHGNPISLRDLAKGVFENFRAGHLLKIGALPTPKGDGAIPTLTNGIHRIEIPRRPTIEDIVALMKSDGVSEIGQTR